MPIRNRSRAIILAAPALAIAVAAASCKKTVETKELTRLDVTLPNDAYFGSLWGMKKIEAPTAWGVQTDCSAIRVAVVDTGIDWNHPDLSTNVWTNSGEVAGNTTDDDANGYVDDIHGWNFDANSANASDDNLHGTHVSGTIGAIGDNGLGVAGVCWKAEIMAVKVLDDTGAGTNASVASGIDYAVNNGAKVINLSLGGTATDAGVQTAIANAKAAGVLVVAAAGNSANDNDTLPFYPAGYDYDNVISVASIKKNDTLSSFSNYGDLTVHIAAPGSGILSTFPTTVTDEMEYLGQTSNYESIDGTSMATPHVVGAAALVWAHHPTWTYAQVRSFLFDNAEYVSALSGKVIGARRLKLGPGI